MNKKTIMKEVNCIKIYIFLKSHNLFQKQLSLMPHSYKNQEGQYIFSQKGIQITISFLANTEPPPPPPPSYMKINCKQGEGGRRAVVFCVYVVKLRYSVAPWALKCKVRIIKFMRRTNGRTNTNVEQSHNIDTCDVLST